MSSNVNNQIYDQFANTLWDENQFLDLLKAMVNPWRVPYFENILADQYGQDLSQVRLLDIGCGGGVLTEEFAARGCRATGIDPSPKSIAVAQAHASMSGLSIDYQLGSGISLPFNNNSFDLLVVAMCWNTSVIGWMSLLK